MSFTNLPTELALEIFKHAALAHITGHRPWVVKLALVSNAVYEIVRPFLYHTLIITDKNCEHFKTPNSLDRIIPFVRSISVFVDDPEWLHDDVYQYICRWAPPADAQAHFDAPWPIAVDILSRLQDLHPTPTCIIASMLVRYDLLHHVILPAFTTSMPAKIATHLKRIGGYLPDEGTWHTAPDSRLSSPRAWGQAVLDALPSLQQVIFRLLDIRHFAFGIKEHLIEVREMLRWILEQRPYLEVTILVGGEYLQHETEVRVLLVDLGLQNMWFDWRTTSWTKVDEAEHEDSWSGRDVWSSPPPMVPSVPSMSRCD